MLTSTPAPPPKCNHVKVAVPRSRRSWQYTKNSSPAPKYRPEQFPKGHWRISVCCIVNFVALCPIRAKTGCILKPVWKTCRTHPLLLKLVLKVKIINKWTGNGGILGKIRWNLGKNWIWSGLKSGWTQQDFFLLIQQREIRLPFLHFSSCPVGVTTKNHSYTKKEGGFYE